MLFRNASNQNNFVCIVIPFTRFNDLVGLKEESGTYWIFLRVAEGGVTHAYILILCFKWHVSLVLNVCPYFRVSNLFP